MTHSVILTEIINFVFSTTARTCKKKSCLKKQLNRVIIELIAIIIKKM